MCQAELPENTTDGTGHFFPNDKCKSMTAVAHSVVHRTQKKTHLRLDSASLAHLVYHVGIKKFPCFNTMILLSYHSLVFGGSLVSLLCAMFLLFRWVKFFICSWAVL